MLCLELRLRPWSTSDSLHPLYGLGLPIRNKPHSKPAEEQFSLKPRKSATKYLQTPNSEKIESSELLCLAKNSGKLKYQKTP